VGVSDAYGADVPEAEDWWLASDGRYYPPELASERATSPGEAAPPAKKKKKKKKLVKKAAARPADHDAEPAGTAPAKAAKKKVVKKKKVAPAATSRPAAPEPEPEPELEPEQVDEFDDEYDEELAYLIASAPSEQVAARRIQAQEQKMMLSGARAQAAMRLLATVSGEETALVNAGARSFDARGLSTDREGSVAARATPAGPATGHRGAADTATSAGQAPGSPTLDDPPSSTPASNRPTSAAAPSARLTPQDPPEAEPATADDEAPPEDSAVPVGGETAPDTAGPASGESTITVEPHQPLKGPDPRTAPMGTDVPFMEVKGSALATDIDRIGEKILIFADRVELRDRNNAVRQTIRYDQLAAVEVQKKLMGPALVIVSAAGVTMTAKALGPELATGAKAMIEKHAERYVSGTASTTSVAGAPADPPAEDAPGADTGVTGPGARPTGKSSGAGPTGSSATITSEATPPAPSTTPPAPSTSPPATGEQRSGAAADGPSNGTAATTDAAERGRERAPAIGSSRAHHSVLAAMLEELHDAGILTAEELEAKRALVDPNLDR
jgi:hypothetical protein